MSYSSTAAKVAEHKRKNPELFCPVPGCLWRTGGGRCPRHGGLPKDPAREAYLRTTWERCATKGKQP